MKKPDKKIICTYFKEQTNQPIETATELDIVIEAPFSSEDYCQAIFQKVLTIGLSESAAFLDHHCSLVKNPVLWINTLEKLLKENVEKFKTKILLHRQIKFISQIDLKRHELKEAASKPEKKHKKLNGYNTDKEYSFSSVKESLNTYETSDEKISFLRNQIFDYKQNPPDFLSTKEQPFDLQCSLEIERIEIQELHNQKIKNKKNTTGNGVKNVVNGDLKILCDVFFKMMSRVYDDGQRMLPWTIMQATEHICRSFCDADGASFNPLTVRTYLSASKPENRPKSDTEFNVL
jgi:hypothetical protein